ncbi:hypothetical protein FACS189487_00220 [Campylobacterota bacterium]|nr:hypothetical protein FACS189487_00220 [Campylobacterota bacterium]
MKCIVVIPSRYASTRLPGKPLALIAGKAMIVRVWEQARQARRADRVLVATDDVRIKAAVEAAGGEAVLTRADHANGTSRLIEVAKQFDAEAFVNVQGDEPFIDPASIDAAIELLEREKGADIATLYTAIADEEAQNPNAVKLVLDGNSRALYFSRSRIPFDRDGAGAAYYKHIGLYAYRREALLAYEKLPPSPLEEAEKLEQLRYLHSGFAIYAAPSSAPNIAIDTPEDLRRAEAFANGRAIGSPLDTLAPLASVRLLLTDIDGVLAPSSLIFDEHGENHKQFDVRDGLGIEVLQKLGVIVGVITGRDSKALRKRLEILRIEHARFGVKDKGEACRALMAELGVAPEETIFVGDDAPDLAAFEACGISCAVADAPEYIRSAAAITLAHKGGNGAIREVVDMLLTARGKLELLSSAKGYLSLVGK